MIMRIKGILVVLIWLVALSNVVHAEIIYLKNGKIIRGKLIEKTDAQLKIDISGVKITYYMDEVDRIEADPLKEGAVKNASAVDVSGQEARKLGAVAPSIVVEDRGIEKPGELVDRALTGGVASSSVASRDNSLAALPTTKRDLILTFIDVSGTRSTMMEIFDQIKKQSPEDQKEMLNKILNIEEILIG